MADPESNTLGLELETHEVAGELHLRPRGDLDIATGGSFYDHARDLMRDRTTVLVLDLRDVRFIDSVGLRCLITLQAESDATGCRLECVSGDSPVRRQIELVGLTELLHLREP